MFLCLRPFLLSGLLLAAGSVALAQSQPVIEDKVYAYVEQMPRFPGGQAALFRTLGQSVQYPAEAIAQQLEGRVIVTFVVASTGSVQQVKVAKSVHPLLDAEAARAVAALPAFEPGRQAGRAVAVSYAVPLVFTLPAATAALPGPRPVSEDTHVPHTTGGQAALAAYLTGVAYPAAARQSQAAGLVFVSVKVDSLGTLTSVKAQAAPSADKKQRGQTALLTAAEDIVRNGPAWAPALKKGQARGGSHVIPLVFDAAAGTVGLYPRVRLFPDEPATTEGGPSAVSNFIGRNVKYPPAALRSRTSGLVKIFFEVNEQGYAENPLVMQSVSRELDAEALRVIASLPQLYPALEKGQPVRSFFIAPVTYSIR